MPSSLGCSYVSSWLSCGHAFGVENSRSDDNLSCALYQEAQGVDLSHSKDTVFTFVIHVYGEMF